MGGNSSVTVVTPPPSPGGTTGGTTGTTGTTDVQVLQQLLAEWQKQFDNGNDLVGIDYQTITTAGVLQRLYTSSFKVRKAIIQSLSNTDTITLFATGSSNGGGGTSGKGFVLNPATSAGQGGGSITVSNIDLYNLWITCSTNNAQTFSVYYET